MEGFPLRYGISVQTRVVGASKCVRLFAILGPRTARTAGPDGADATRFWNASRARRFPSSVSTTNLALLFAMEIGPRSWRRSVTSQSNVFHVFHARACPRSLGASPATLSSMAASGPEQEK